MRALAGPFALFAAVLLTGCVTDRRAHRFCDLDDEHWTILPQPPPDADAALVLVNMQPARFTRIAWFESEDHRIGVCQLRPPPQGFCGLRRLLLKRGADGHWESAETDGQLELIGVCG